MNILSNFYHGLSGLARTVKDGVVSRFRGKKAEVVRHPVRQMKESTPGSFDTHAGIRQMTERNLSGFDTQQGSVANKGYLLAKELSDQSLSAHKVSSIELPPRFPFVEVKEENKKPQESPSRARKILTALMPGNAALPEGSDISVKRARRGQTRRLRKGLQTIKRETGLDVSIRNFDNQAAHLRDFLTGNGATPGYQEIKVFFDQVKSVMAKADSLPGLIKLAVTEYMVVLSDLGQAAQFKALGQRQQLAEHFLPGHDGFKAHCLRRNLDPDSALSLQYLNQFQGKLMGWQDDQGHWHPGLVEDLELSSMPALRNRLEAELEAFINQIGGVIPQPSHTAPLTHDQLQKEVAQLYGKHGIKDLPNKQQNPITHSSAELNPGLKSATRYQVRPSGNLQNHPAVPLEKARVHHWVFEQLLSDYQKTHAEIDQKLWQSQTTLKSQLIDIDESQFHPEQDHDEPNPSTQHSPSEALDEAQKHFNALHKRKRNTQFPPLPTLILRNSKGTRIDSDFMKKPELDDPDFTLHVVRCQTEDYKQINQVLLNTPGFESKEALDQFKDTMRSFRNHCYQYAIGAALPSKVFSENDTKLLINCRQRINSAMETLLANPETGDTAAAFHYLRMQEAVLENFLKMNDLL
ncbi:hypothetical protein [Endozoicomonas numazuensis]|uniref:Uncharacterized protein n=1 Tax=Endozoicomonas numazuensis TaxID=1137799 RepID=A0A081NJK7_9GAMM|nr:hypothetical protein [Endozoicomonas numazuensis]KEQ18630.1 hypothetical protein GZ78_00395 [Endozoicomonas numazuensis]